MGMIMEREGGSMKWLKLVFSKISSALDEF
jgi:hypothetical protein